MRSVLDKRHAFLGLSFVTGTGLIILSGIYTNFHVVGNDFWSVLYYGRHITWSQKESLYNGFFPIGYAFLIGKFPYAYVIQLAYFTNAILTGLAAASVTGIVATVGRLPVALFTLAALLITPIIFQYGNTVGPDVGAMAFLALAVYLLWKDRLSESSHSVPMRRSIAIGVSIGIASLWRSHAIVFALSLVSLTFLFSGLQPIRGRLWMICSFVSVMAIQLLANLISGHGLLETGQTFNVYKFLYGIDWSQPPSEAVIRSFSLVEAIRSNPRFFFSTYSMTYGDLALYASPGLACFLVAPRGAIKEYGLFSALITLIYAVPIALGGSPRAPLILMVPFLSSLAFLIVALAERIMTQTGPFKRLWEAGLALVLMLCAFQAGRWVLQDLDFLRKNYQEHRAFLSIERVLMAQGLTTSTQVFSDYYNFYLPNFPPYQPRFVGGWEEDWLWGYGQEFPSLPTDSWGHFVHASKEQGIQFLALSPSNVGCGKLFPATAGGNEPGPYFVARRSGFNICRLERK